MPVKNRRFIRLAARLRPPRRTVQLRLTLLYGALFLVSGAGLLAITYLLVQHATGDVLSYNGPNGTGGIIDSPHHATAPPGHATSGPGGDVQTDQDQLRTQAQSWHDSEMRALLTQSGIALGMMAVISIGLGWIVAGRTLRPLRTITTATRTISVTNLHERLALDGPRDELKELGDTIDELLTRLESSFGSQRQFIANASHELRSPLARQRTLAQVALADPEATVESLREAHERVLVCGAQQERTIAALLTLARGQAGLDHREPFDLARLAAAVLAARRQEAEQQGLKLHTTFAPAPTAGAPSLAEPLIANLVDNAMRYNTSPGRLEVFTGVQDGHPVLRVVNTGPVVPPDAVDRLFQPFQRLGSERTRHGGGLGLGLSIVQAIATAHGARVTADSRPTGGLLITVRFPPAAFPRQVSTSGAGGWSLSHPDEPGWDSGRDPSGAVTGYRSGARSASS